MKALREQGGDRYAAFREAQQDLRLRERNLTERNPDAQVARGERLQERIDGAGEQIEKSLEAFGKRAKNLLNSIRNDPAAKAQEAAQTVAAQVEALRMRITSATERANKLAAQYVDQMDPQRAFQEAADRAVAQGATGDAAIRAATKEADRVTKQVKDAQSAIADYERQVAKLEAMSEKLANRETAIDAAREFAAELEKTLAAARNKVAQRTARRGEKLAELKAKAAKLTPEEVAARAAERETKLNSNIDNEEVRFDSRWGARKAKGLEAGEAYDFEAAGRDAASQIFAKLTGQSPATDRLPGMIVAAERGPLKDRTFMVPDELLAGRGWLVDDVREVANRYTRAMAGEIELTRRFGRADMADQITQVQKEYSDMMVAIDRAKSIDEINSILGRDKFGKNKDLTKAKLKANKLLVDDRKSAVRDMEAGRDLIRGSYDNDGPFGNASTFGSLSRAAMGFNYIRAMGGQLLSSIGEFYRPAMVHGLGQYMKNLPDLLTEIGGAGSQGLKMSLQEAKMSGLLSERLLAAMHAANGDLGDPFASKVVGIERLMQKGSRLASRWNLVNIMTDAQQAMASIASQHRIVEAVLNPTAQNGTFIKGDHQAMLRMLGVTKQTQADIARYFAAHGETLDGFHIPNTEKWLEAANATGIPAEITRAENAVRVYRTAVGTDVNSIISRKGLGDAPLFANTAFGKLIFQFSGYTLGAHSRVMIRGLQESNARLISGVIGMTTLGMMSSYLASFRSGREGHEKRMNEWRANPAMMLGEGVDRSGIFPLMFDFANRFEKITGAVGQDYRVNPIKSTIAAAGGSNPLGVVSTRGAESSTALGALAGPTFGMFETTIAAGRVAADLATGKEPPKRNVNQAIAGIPYSSYIGMKALLQILTGNSNFTRQ